MTRTLYLHIGLPKCASSSIQDMFYLKKLRTGDFEHKNYDYPLFKHFNTDVWISSHNIYMNAIFNRHQSIENQINSSALLINYFKGWPASKVQTVFNKFKEEFIAYFEYYQHDNVILSSEVVANFHTIDVEYMLTFFKQFVDNIHNVICVRNPKARVTSEIQQVVKYGDTIQRKLKDYKNATPLIIDVHGMYCNNPKVDNIMVYNIDDSERQYNLPETMLIDFGLKKTAFKETIHSNQSLTNQSVRDLSVLNSLDDNFVFRNYLWKTSTADDKFILTDDEQYQIKDYIKEETQFLNDQLGFDFNE